MLIKEKRGLRCTFKSLRDSEGRGSLGTQIAALQYKIKAKELRKPLIDDKFCFVHKHSSEALSAYHSGQMREFWSVRKFLVFIKPRMPPSYLVDDEGKRSDSYSEVRSSICEFFSSLLQSIMLILQLF